MHKRILIAVLVLVMCLGSAANIAADAVESPGIQVNGKMLDASAIMLEGEVFLPLRAVAGELGYDLQWLGSKKGISLCSADNEIYIDLSEYKYSVNGHESFLAGEYRLVNGVSYLRRDLFSYVLRLWIELDKASNRVILQNIDENDIKINTIKKTYETRELKLSLQYPQLAGLENSEAEKKLNSMFAGLASEAGDRGYQAGKVMIEEQLARGIKAEAFYDYRVEYNQKGIISIVFLDYIYSGGAHGLTVQSSYTIDLKTGTVYELKDVFKAEDYVSIISSEVKKQMEERKMTGYLPPFEAIRPDQDFFLSNNSLVVYFQAYEYTPYAAGIPEFELGFPSIEKYLGAGFEYLNSIPLQFIREASLEQVEKVSNKQIGAVLKNVDVAGGRAYIYEKVGDNGSLHGGFTSEGAFYDLGAVGEVQNFLDDLTHVKTFELYGKTVVKFQGAFGSHVPNTSYFIIEQGVPVSFLTIQGIVSEMDIDRDGVKEIITELPGTIPAVDISEWDGGSFKTASVDIGLGAGSVIFNREDGSFSAYYRKEGIGSTCIVEYIYDGSGMKLKKASDKAGNIISENTIDTNGDGKYERLIVRLAEGKQYEDTAAGPFQGWNWQGKFLLQLTDYKGSNLSELELNKAFEEEELIFNRTFLISFDDYNNDENPDFAIGQYGSSNGNLYRLFTVRDNKIEVLPLQTSSVFSSGGSSRHSISLERISDIGFMNSYYDNTKGKLIEQYFIWDGSQFALKNTIEK